MELCSLRIAYTKNGESIKLQSRHHKFCEAASEHRGSRLDTRAVASAARVGGRRQRPLKNINWIGARATALDVGRPGAKCTG